MYRRGSSRRRERASKITKLVKSPGGAGHGLNEM